MEELRGWIVCGGGGGRRRRRCGYEVVEVNENTVRCIGLSRRRGEEAHLARRLRRRQWEEAGEGNGGKWSFFFLSAYKNEEEGSVGESASVWASGYV